MVLKSVKFVFHDAKIRSDHNDLKGLRKYLFILHLGRIYEIGSSFNVESLVDSFRIIMSHLKYLIFIFDDFISILLKTLEINHQITPSF